MTEKKFNKKNTINFAIVIVAYILLRAFYYLIPRAIIVWLGMAVVVAVLIYKLFLSKLMTGTEQEGEQKNSFFNLPEMLFIIALSALSMYSDYYFVGGNDIPFWLVSALFGVPIGIFVGFKYIDKDSKIYWRILSFALCCVICFAMVHTFIRHLNYALSTDEPQQYTVVILDKDKDSSGKSTDYEFLIESDGERFWLDVNSTEYGRYDVGDKYSILRYNGAFGKAFYIPDPQVKLR